MQILLIEDNEALTKAIETLLISEKYSIVSAKDGEEGLLFMTSMEFDLVIIDRMLPKLDGLTALRKARESGMKSPVLMMTALGQISDKVEGLDAGADDYIVKPFDNREFFARIKALLRRSNTLIQNEDVLTFKDLTLDYSNTTLTGSLGFTTLSVKENDILKLLIENAENVISRDTLFSKVWGFESDVDYSNIDSYIYYVRKRLRSVSERVIIKTLHKSGYRLEEIYDK